MLTDPILIFLKCFSTWLRIRMLMGLAIAWCIILLALSLWLMSSDAGSFGWISFPSGRSYGSWDSAVCSQSPYAYLRPFAFSYDSDKFGASTSNCAWPKANTDLRITLTVFSVVVCSVLFFQTPFSLVARIALACSAVLFFAVFVLDYASMIAGQSFCLSGFENTPLTKDLAWLGTEISCENMPDEVVVVMDLVASGIFFILHSAWVLAKDRYVEK